MRPCRIPSGFYTLGLSSSSLGHRRGGLIPFGNHPILSHSYNAQVLIRKESPSQSGILSTLDFPEEKNGGLKNETGIFNEALGMPEMS